MKYKWNGNINNNIRIINIINEIIMKNNRNNNNIINNNK